MHHADFAASGEIGELGRHLPAQQHVARFPLLRRGQLLEEAHLAPRQERDRHAIAIQQAVTAQ